MDKDKISVIVPMYNASKTIKKCLNSITNQNYSNIELIIIDDGSSDNCWEIAESYLSQCDINYVIKRKENGGVSSARNMGIDISSGKYLVFVDSDDELGLDFLNSAYDELKQKNGDMIISGYVVKVNGSIIKRYNPKFQCVMDRNDYVDFITEMVDDRYILSPWAKIFKADIIKENNIRFDETKSIGEDLIFNLNYLKYGKIIRTVSCVGYHYCINENDSLIHNFTDERINNSIILFHESVGLCDQIHIENCKFAFLKYYYKSQLNFLENRINNKQSNKQIKEYVDKILMQDIISDVSKFENKGDMELMVYNYVFSNRCKLAILGICKLRIFVKKYIRGY